MIECERGKKMDNTGLEHLTADETSKHSLNTVSLVYLTCT